jgi:hypothetical protein
VGVQTVEYLAERQHVGAAASSIANGMPSNRRQMSTSAPSSAVDGTRRLAVAHDQRTDHALVANGKGDST